MDPLRWSLIHHYSDEFFFRVDGEDGSQNARPPGITLTTGGPSEPLMQSNREAKTKTIARTRSRP